MKNTNIPDAAPATQRPCALEGDFSQFSAGVIKEHPAEAPFMSDLNRIHDLVSGLGVVMRIVVGNSVLEDFYVPGTKTEPPLSRSAVGRLESMVVTVCEMIAEDIDMTALKYKIGSDA